MKRQDLQTALSGRRLTKSEVAALEHAVAVAPSHVTSRLRLLGYYFGQRRSGPANDRRAEHILWFIEQHPEREIVGTPHCWIDPEDPNFARACDAWKRVLGSGTVPPIAILNAAGFFTLSDPDQCRQLLERGEREAPSWPDWASQLGAQILRSVKQARTMTASERTPETNEDQLKTLANEALLHFERALALTPADAWRLDLNQECAEAALACGRFEQAARYADALLDVTSMCMDNPHRLDWLHKAHIVRGHVAIEAGDVEAAKRELEQAAAQGSEQAPVLSTFGPDFSLAQRLLAIGEIDAVRAYLDRCATFWDPTRIARWKNALERGERPRMHTGYEIPGDSLA